MNHIDKLRKRYGHPRLNIGDRCLNDEGTEYIIESFEVIRAGKYRCDLLVTPLMSPAFTVGQCPYVESQHHRRRYLK